MDSSNMQSGVASREHLRALDTLSRARTFCIALALFAVASHVAVWVAVTFFDVLQNPPPLNVNGSAASAPVETVAYNADSSGQAELRAGYIAPLMSFAEFLGRCAIILLCVTMLLAVLVAVSGRLAGVSDLIAGFYVAIIVAALFIPWDRLTPRDTAFSGVFTTLEKVRQRDAIHRATPTGDHATFFDRDIGIKRHDWDIGLDGARFAGLPLFAAILLLGTGRRFTRAYRHAARSGTHEIPMKVV